MSIAYTLYGDSYDIETPDQTIRGTATIQGKFNVVSDGRMITLTNPSKATLKYYIQTYGDVTHVGSNQRVAYGNDDLFHFVEIPKQYPITPIVTADIQTNSGDVCNHWDAVCHAQQGIDTIVENVMQTGEGISTSVDEGIQWANDGLTQTGIDFQNAIDQQTENYTTWMNEAQQNFNNALTDAAKAAQDAADATVKAAQDAADATVKAAQDAADAAAKAAADTAAAAGEGATKGISDTLKIAGVAALGLGVLMVMKK